jgi:phage terminase large subunit-like protein
VAPIRITGACCTGGSGKRLERFDWMFGPGVASKELAVIPGGILRQEIVDGINGNGVMRQAGKVHPPFEVVGTQMLWLNAFESTGSPGKLRAF